MTFSETLVLFVKQMEGFRSVAYHDVAGRLTVGYGEAEGVVPGQVVSEQEADLMLRGTLSEVAEQVRKAVTVDLTQGQFDALCDFAFNLGIGSLTRSELLALLNAGDYSGAAEQFPRWCLASGKVLPGLQKRRAIEQQWFTRPAENAA